jgi:hypothetical protein
LEERLPRAKELAVRARVAFVLLALVACHVTPLPVPHPEEWEPGYGSTECPPLSVGGPIADAGAREAAP